jgi:hypothetical protein
VAPGAIALFAVPYLNRSRQNWLTSIPLAHDTTLENGFSFYQYWSSIGTFSRLLRGAGYRVIALHPYALEAGATHDYALGRYLDQQGFFHWSIRRWLNSACRNAPKWARFGVLPTLREVKLGWVLLLDGEMSTEFILNRRVSSSEWRIHRLRAL